MRYSTFAASQLQVTTAATVKAMSSHVDNYAGRTIRSNSLKLSLPLGAFRLRAVRLLPRRTTRTSTTTSRSSSCSPTTAPSRSQGSSNALPRKTAQSKLARLVEVMVSACLLIHALIYQSDRLTLPGYATYALGGPDGFMILGLLQRLR